MCNPACIRFVEHRLTAAEIGGKAVLEVGSKNENGSVRPAIEAYGPARYWGVDLRPGKGVDQVCNAVDLVTTFGEARFEVVVSTEMLEHAEHWRAAVSNMKRVLTPGGVLYITTRAEGFPWHGYPADYWRYSVEDMQVIFADFDLLTCIPDPYEPGVFLKARKPLDFVEVDLSAYALYSINEGRRVV